MRHSQYHHTTQQEDAQPDRHCDTQHSRVIIDYILAQFHICVYIYLVKQVRLNLYPKIIQSLKLAVPVIYVSKKI